MQLATNTVRQARPSIPLQKLTLGLPFYSRDIYSGPFPAHNFKTSFSKFFHRSR